MKRILLRIFAVLLLISLWILWGNVTVGITEYDIADPEIPESFTGFRIAQISDLHNTEFGEGNRYLLWKISKAKPDIIVITGDLIDSRRPDVQVAVDFCRKAAEIAPVYYVTGNHEISLGFANLKDPLEQTGIQILEYEKVEIYRGEDCITLAGIHDDAMYWRYWSGDFRPSYEDIFAELKEVGQGYTVLLSHKPALFEKYVDGGFDLVLTGHNHGGQFRIPFIGGVYAPEQGFFPEFDAGLYEAGDTTMIISRGVGRSQIPVRLNNRPEIVVCELIHERG